MTKPGLARWGVRACYRVGVALLFFAVAALSVQAKNNWYLPKSNPARYVSKISRMEEATVRRESLGASRVRSGRVSPTPRPRALEAQAKALSWLETPRIQLSVLANAEQLRSPPA